MFADAVDCAADGLIADAGGPAWDAAGFAALADKVRSGASAATWEVVTAAEEILRRAHAVEIRLDGLRSPALAPATDDIRGQLRGLVRPGFLTATGARRLPAVARYLRAVEYRLDKLADNAGRDAQQMAVVQRVTAEYEDALAVLPAATAASQAARDIRWLIEELRVSLFAQTIGTPLPVSERRVRSAIEHLG
jgi:ATP-dependent helicase HrpA